MERTTPEAPELKHQDRCDSNPEFAVICAFIAQFGDKIDLELNIEQLKSAIEDINELDESLIDLHVKLLKKTRRYFVRDQWEKALIRFAAEYSYADAYEIESLGYRKTRPSIRLELLRRLLDAQFECDQKFKSAVNLCEASQLRILPLGRDIKGNTYWQRTDKEGNFRIFQEEPLDYKSWKAICTNPEELNYLINELENSKEDRVKGEPMFMPYDPYPEIFPEYFKKKEQEPLEENSIKQKQPKSKKGRPKKPPLLPVLEEVKEETQQEETNIKLEVELEVSGSSGLPKKNILPNIEENKATQSDPKESSTVLISSSSDQVRSTIENLISRVVSSIGNFIRPLSRNSATPEKVEEPKKSKAGRAKGKRDKPKEEVLPRRTSSRIQQLQLKKVAEQEEELKKKSDNNATKKTESCSSASENESRNRHKDRKKAGSGEECERKGRKKRKKEHSWKSRKGKKKLSWDKDDSDLSSTSSLTESEVEPSDELEESFELENINYDDEFACEEEEDANNEPVIIKRARTARQSTGAEEGGNDANSSIEEDKPCERCDKSNDPEWILLCDICDIGYHLACCIPPLMIVPDGDWFCPPCEHKMLVTKLQELYASITEILEERERERVKRQRLRQHNSKKDTIKSESQEVLPITRERGFLSELNEPIAVQALDEDLDDYESSSVSSRGRAHKKSNRSQKSKKNARGKQKSRRRYYDDERDFVDDDSEDELVYTKPQRTYSKRDRSNSDFSESESIDQSSDSSGNSKPKTRRARACVSYRFQEYEDMIKSAIHGEDSYGEEPSEKEKSPEECNQGRGKDMATIEAYAYQQENGLEDQTGSGVSGLPTIESEPNSKNRPKKKSRRLNDLDALSETEDADSDVSFQASSATDMEDEDLTEAEHSEETDSSIDELVAIKYSKKNKKAAKRRRTSYSSDGSDYQPSRTRRRAAAARVSYKESTDDEDTESNTVLKTAKKSKKNTLSSDESQASWRSNAESQREECEVLSEEINAESDLEGIDDDRHDVNREVSELDEEFDKAEHVLSCAPSIELKIADVEKTIAMEKQNKLLNHSSVTDRSIDELAAPLLKPQTNDLTSCIPTTLAKSNQASCQSETDPMEQLDQYCNESAGPVTSMFKSYNDILSKRNPAFSTTHPPFYTDDALNPENKQ